MKLSVSLPEADVRLLDDYARATGLPSRSAAVHHAISMLRLAGLEREYAAAWEEWESSGPSVAWAQAVGDGLTDAAR